MNKIALLTVIACGLAVGYTIADRASFSFPGQKARAIAQRFDEYCLAGLKSRATTDFRQTERSEFTPFQVALKHTRWIDPITGGYFIFDERECSLGFLGQNVPRRRADARYLKNFVEARINELAPEIKLDPKATLGPDTFFAAWTNWEDAPFWHRWGVSFYIDNHNPETASARMSIQLPRH